MDIKQEERESVADYAQQFGEQVEATESLWGPLFPTMTFQDIVTGGDAASEASEAEAAEAEEEETAEAKLAQLEETMEAEKEAAVARAIKQVQDKAKARNKFLACLFLAKADRGRFKGRTDELANRFT